MYKKPLLHGSYLDKKNRVILSVSISELTLPLVELAVEKQNQPRVECYIISFYQQLVFLQFLNVR